MRNVLCLFIIMFCFVVGCEDSNHRAALLESISQAEGALLDVDATIVQLVEQGYDVTESLQIKVNFEAAITRWKKELASLSGDGGLGDNLRAYGTGVQSFAPILPPPWNAVAVTLGGALVTAGGFVIRKLQVKLKKTKNDSANIVNSVSEMLKAIPPDIVLVAKAVLKDNQTIEARAFVRTIKDLSLSG